jgi:RNA polymerase sigma-70 factor (ECF subfamily)
MARLDMPDADAELVRRTLAGETTAFEELVRAYRPRMLRLAALIIGNADEAENLTQEALARAYSQLATFDETFPFAAWVRGIVLNLCRNFLRDHQRHARPVAPDQLTNTQAREGRRLGVLSGILRREVNDHLLTAISGLPVAMREAFVLHFIEEMDYAQISQITGVAAGTLRVRALRARSLLRENLGSVVDTWMRSEPQTLE